MTATGFFISPPPPMYRTAVLSDDGCYRYLLSRKWAGGPIVTWVMLNPSTADSEIDDATVRKVIGFSRRAGFGTAVVANLYGLRTSDPDELSLHADPVGPRNDGYLAAALERNGPVVVAWGARGAARGPLLGREVWTLGFTKSGQPRHPARLPYAKGLPFTPWRIEH